MTHAVVACSVFPIINFSPTTVLSNFCWYYYVPHQKIKEAPVLLVADGKGSLDPLAQYFLEGRNTKWIEITCDLSAYHFAIYESISNIKILVHTPLFSSYILFHVSATSNLVIILFQEVGPKSASNKTKSGSFLSHPKIPEVIFKFFMIRDVSYHEFHKRDAIISVKWLSYEGF